MPFFLAEKINKLAAFTQTLCADVEFDINGTDLKKGQPVSNMVAFDMSSTQVSVDEAIKGKVAVVVFWATYAEQECMAFLEHFSAMAESQKAWKNKVAVLMVSVDEHIE